MKVLFKESKSLLLRVIFCVPLGDRSKDRAAEKPQMLKSEGK